MTKVERVEVLFLSHGVLSLTSTDLTEMGDELEGVLNRIIENSYVVEPADITELEILLAMLKGRFFGP